MSLGAELAGQTFGRLVAIEVDHVEGGHGHWRCRCECGATLVVRRSNLTSGNTRSCGCLLADRRSPMPWPGVIVREETYDRLEANARIAGLSVREFLTVSL